MLIHYVAKILDKATTMDGDGNEYLEQVTLDKAFIEDLKKAFDYQVNHNNVEMEGRTWELFSRVVSSDAMLNAKPEIEDIERIKKDVKLIVETYYKDI